ncbi:MAG TPA: triose-phosphate isomerase [Longimicrobiales bacterium]|nr:triose-phosphate isomerase [Longimicrobiales bacterium]
MAVIAGNWKMHHGPSAAEAFFADLTLPDNAGAHEVVIFPPALSLAAARGARGRDPRIQLGVQNVHFEREGAFTGEVSAVMARDAGATFVLVGHSERRHVFGETDDDVARKVRAVLAAGLAPVICVGETLDERRAGRVDDVILAQLDAALSALGAGDGRFLLAYEPVWAIGTGETATPRDASAAHGTLRARLDDRLGAARSTRTPILYGGSVKPPNAAELLGAPDVDGVLVGGASLDAGSFAAIVAAAR